MRIHHVQIVIPAGRESEARGFYEGLLGLEPIARPEGARGRGFWYRVGDQEVHLREVEEGFRADAHAHTAFLVPDPARLRAGIEGADFEVRPAPPQDGKQRFHTRDPFGNRLEFMEE
jgi:catechol 2,3-dioxygenase-like lactoylglutathione lyase family enzyme